LGRFQGGSGPFPFQFFIFAGSIFLRVGGFLHFHAPRAGGPPSRAPKPRDKHLGGESFKPWGWSLGLLAHQPGGQRKKRGVWPVLRGPFNLPLVGFGLVPGTLRNQELIPNPTRGFGGPILLGWAPKVGPFLYPFGHP